MKVIVDVEGFKSLVDEEFKWDKEYKEACGWNDHDISMIAEGMKEATNKLLEMVYVRKTAQEVVYCKDCAYYDKTGAHPVCSLAKYSVSDNDFCSNFIKIV